MRGYWGIGIYNPKHEANLGGVWRSAQAFDADFIFTVGPRRYSEQCTDTMKSTRHVPLFHYPTIEDLKAHIPNSCPIVAVEYPLAKQSLSEFSHPERAMYLLGSEDNGLPLNVINQCHYVISVPTKVCLNLASAATVVMYDRVLRGPSSRFS